MLWLPCLRQSDFLFLLVIAPNPLNFSESQRRLGCLESLLPDVLHLSRIAYHCSPFQHLFTGWMFGYIVFIISINTICSGYDRSEAAKLASSEKSFYWFYDQCQLFDN